MSASLLALLLACEAPGSTPDSPVVDDTGASPAPEGASFVVLAAPDLEEVGVAWAEWRASQGFRTEVLRTDHLVDDPEDGEALAAAVRERLIALRAEGEPQYLLILGDAPEKKFRVERHVPSPECENDLEGGTTDNVYGDLDGDGLPEVAVGRVPAYDAEEAEAVLARTQAYESDLSVGVFNRRVVFWAGETGFSEQDTAVIEASVMQGLAQVNPAYEITGVYADPSSIYYDHPFEKRVVELLNEGSVLALYLGHGLANYNQGLPTSALAQLDFGGHAPMMALFACWNGAFAGDEDSLAEELLSMEGGPVGIFAGTGETHPYANGVIPYELQRVALSGELTRVGDVLLAAKARSMAPAAGDETRELMDFYAMTAYSFSEADLQRILRQHLDLYNLLGDPAAPIRRPQALAEIEVEGGAWDEHLVVSGTAPGVGQGRAWVTFEIPRDEVLADDTWEQAINTVVTGVEVPVVDGAFSAEMSFDYSDLPGDTFYVKVYAADESHDAFGAVEVH